MFIENYTHVLFACCHQINFSKRFFRSYYEDGCENWRTVWKSRAQSLVFISDACTNTSASNIRRRSNALFISDVCSRQINTLLRLRMLLALVLASLVKTRLKRNAGLRTSHFYKPIRFYLEVHVQYEIGKFLPWVPEVFPVGWDRPKTDLTNSPRQWEYNWYIAERKKSVFYLQRSSVFI